ncbi:MAG: hypothetical protein ACRDZW_07300, partial [Acidimicrobiales bacterium]
WVYRGEAAQWRTMLALLRGQLDKVESLVEETMTLTGGEANYAIASQGQRFFLSRELGRLDEARAAAAEATRRYPGLFVLRALLALAQAETGDLDRARAVLARAAADDFAEARREFTWIASTAMLAETCALVGDTAAAATLYRLLQPHAGRLVVFGWGVVCGGPVDRYLARLAATLGRWDEAEAMYRSALATLTHLGAAPLTVRTTLAYARMLGARARPGDLARSLDLLAEADEAATALGMGGVATEIAALRALNSPDAPAGAGRPGRAGRSTRRPGS